jgi:hypothetical protein
VTSHVPANTVVGGGSKVMGGAAGLLAESLMAQPVIVITSMSSNSHGLKLKLTDIYPPVSSGC